MSIKTAVIASAHGKFSEGIMSTVKMIAGDFENARYINFLDSDNYDSLDEKFRKTFEELKDYDQFIIITDLMGGTPFNRAVINYGSQENVRILSGLNFASLFTAITGQGDNLDQFVEEILSAGRESINKFEFVAKKEDEDLDFEDGI